MTSASDDKWRPFNCFFQSREQVVVRRGQIRRIAWVIMTLETQVGQFLRGCKCPVRGCIVVQEQDHLGDLPVAFFLQNVLQLHQQRWVILRVDSLTIWKLMRRIPSWSQKIEARTFPADFCTRKFWGRVSSYAATPLIVAMSQGHSNITRFRSWSPIATGNHLDLTEKNPKLLRRLAPLTFLIHLQAFRDPLRGELPYVRIFMNDGPNPLTWDAQLLSYWFSRNPAVFQD